MLGELMEWVMNLDREFAFLLALPFAVALAGLLAEKLRSRKAARVEREDAGAVRVRHGHHVWSR
ncbi:MAG TPA: hypothetical protein VED01_24320 [Burkholderiales bacterium]|nr:hypothetical protein [Burkholderiales bacterium]